MDSSHSEEHRLFAAGVPIPSTQTRDVIGDVKPNVPGRTINSKESFGYLRGPAGDTEQDSESRSLTIRPNFFNAATGIKNQHTALTSHGISDSFNLTPFK
jgi:hypothetical protein